MTTPLTWLWQDTPAQVTSALPVPEAGRRLELRRFDTGDLVVRVRHRRGSSCYATWAVRRGTFFSLQRIFFARLEAAPQGSVLRGVLRPRRLGRWFMTAALGVLAVMLLGALAGTLLEVTIGGPGSPLADLAFAGGSAAAVAWWLVVVQISRAGTRTSESLLLAWLAEHLS